MIARYDLSKRNISFDFYAWMVHAYILGYREIVFKVSTGFGKHSQPEHELRKRYESIIKPGPALMGLPSREGDDGEECATHKLWGILGTKVYDFPKLKSVLPPGNARYTVTLRNCPVHPERNSTPMWLEFAQKIGATVIPDFADHAISLYDRMALYADAKMNFGVVNGPMGMLLLSEYPMLMTGCAVAEFAWKKHGVLKGEQLPWFLPSQSLMWEKPTLGNLMAVVEKIEREC